MIMKKIMFNDKYGLTQAVLEGRKTMTRRSIPKKLFEVIKQYAHGNEEELRHRLLANSSYQVGEVVAIAQPYKDIYDDAYHIGLYGRTAGWSNKMYVAAYRMPHHIKITNIRVERLQDISDEDCMKEGIYKHDPVRYNHNFIGYSYDATEDPHLKKWWFRTPREAFQKLIDKVSGVGTWNSNPLVWVYEFELVD